jgi:protein-disulfide isomerase
MDKRFWAIIGIIIAAFAGIMIFNNLNKDDGDTTNAKPTSNITGKTDAKVKLIEYGDFQCSVCGQYYPLVEQVKEKYKDQIAFQFKNLPLPQMHPHAVVAAKAGEAAAKQGKFWEMYEQLFVNQQSWSGLSSASSTFESYAQAIGLDITKYKADIASSSVNGSVNADIAEFNKTGYQKATPTFILNGKQIKPTDLDGFSKLIDAELKKAGIDPPAAAAEDKKAE